MHEPETKKKALITRQRDVRIQSELWHTSNSLLETAQRQDEGSAHPLRASLVFRAFALEALLNWLGQQLVPHWRYLERLSPREKLDLLAELSHIKPDYGSRPWQIVKELFGFRNDIAHGKPEILNSETLEDLDEFLAGKIEFIQTDWERFCTLDNAVKAKQDVSDIATTLYRASGVSAMHKGPVGPFTFGFQTHKAEG